MIVKAKRNILICCGDPFEDVYINPNNIVSVDRYEGELDGKSIIRLSGDFSYISECSFEEVMRLLEEET